jgi:hypothetical protein
MMSAPHCRVLFLPLALATLLPAQAPPKPGSPETQALLDKACQKMLAVGRGTFRTTEEQDNALVRQLGRGGGSDEDGGVEGGWHADLLWARTAGDGDLIVRQRGRSVVQTGKEWRIRRDKLPSGAPMPALFDPDLFFQMVRDLPAEARRVRAVEQAKVKDQDVLVLALTLEGEAAADFAQSGALPPVSMGMGGFTQIVMRGGGMGGARPQQPEVTVDLGLFVEPQGGDVLRVRAKIYEKGAPGGVMRFAVAAAPAGGGAVQLAAPAREAEKEDKDTDKDSGELVYKKGLPERKLGQQESSMYLKVDFADLGKAKPPELDEACKRLLGR